MSLTLNEFLEMTWKEHTKEDAVRVELAIDGIFWRESDAVIARYSRIPKNFIAMLRRHVKSENNKDYFTI